MLFSFKNHDTTPTEWFRFGCGMWGFLCFNIIALSAWVHAIDIPSPYARTVIAKIVEFKSKEHNTMIVQYVVGPYIYIKQIEGSAAANTLNSSIIISYDDRDPAISTDYDKKSINEIRQFVALFIGICGVLTWILVRANRQFTPYSLLSLLKDSASEQEDSLSRTH